jgi:Viral BACON domain/Putative binding domain, N-terminal
MLGDRLLRVAHHAFIILLVVASAIVLSAQTVVDPRYVEFTPSVDHDALGSDGAPLVERYSLSVFVVGSSVAFDTMDLGKPAPSGGIIRVDFLPLLHSTPAPSVVFEARVTAIGPGGSTGSAPSNGFSFTPPCAPSINAPGQSVGSGVTTGSVGVTAGTGCTWSAVSNTSWITLTGSTSGSGNGTVPYSVAANAATSPRTGTLTIAGRTYTVSQAALSCTYALSPTSQSVVAAGGSGSTSVTAAPGCPWTAVSNNTSWLTVTSGASGNGAGNVNVSATANTATQARTGTVAIAGQTFTVIQNAAGCTFSISPSSQSVAAAGATGSATVTSTTGCTWTAASNAAWITVTAGANGSGNGSATFTVAPNTTSSPRTGTLTIAGRTFTATQAANPCSHLLTPASRTIAGAGGTGTITVGTSSGCAWTASTTQTWIAVSGSGTASGSASYTVQPNGGAGSRTGTISIGTQVFTITQSNTTAPVTPVVPQGLRIVTVGGE